MQSKFNEIYELISSDKTALQLEVLDCILILGRGYPLSSSEMEDLPDLTTYMLSRDLLAGALWTFLTFPDLGMPKDLPEVFTFLCELGVPKIRFSNVSTLKPQDVPKFEYDLACAAQLICAIKYERI